VPQESQQRASASSRVPQLRQYGPGGGAALLMDDPRFGGVPVRVTE